MHPPDYRAYLLRIWCTEDGGWRAVLEDPHTGQRRTYATPEALLAFLRMRAEAEATDDRKETP